MTVENQVTKKNTEINLETIFPFFDFDKNPSHEIPNINISSKNNQIEFTYNYQGIEQSNKISTNQIDSLIINLNNKISNYKETFQNLEDEFKKNLKNFLENLKNLVDTTKQDLLNLMIEVLENKENKKENEDDKTKEVNDETNQAIGNIKSKNLGEKIGLKLISSLGLTGLAIQIKNFFKELGFKSPKLFNKLSPEYGELEISKINQKLYNGIGIEEILQKIDSKNFNLSKFCISNVPIHPETYNLLIKEGYFDENDFVPVKKESRRQNKLNIPKISIFGINIIGDGTQYYNFNNTENTSKKIQSFYEKIESYLGLTTKDNNEKIIFTILAFMYPKEFVELYLNEENINELKKIFTTIPSQTKNDENPEDPEDPENPKTQKNNLDYLKFTKKINISNSIISPENREKIYSCKNLENCPEYTNFIKNLKIKIGNENINLLKICKIESNCKSGAKSEKGAIGYYQFMPKTAKNVLESLIQKNKIELPEGINLQTLTPDELTSILNDPIISAIMAKEYLNQIYNFFKENKDSKTKTAFNSLNDKNKIKIILSSYNHGIGNVQKKLKNYYEQILQNPKIKINLATNSISQSLNDNFDAKNDNFAIYSFVDSLPKDTKNYIKFYFEQGQNA